MTAQLDTVPFSVARRGYDRVEVDERIASLTAELAAIAAARDAAVAEARTLTRHLEASRTETRTVRAASTETHAEIDALRAQVVELSTIPSSVDGMSARLQQMVRIAQDEVNDMRTRATTSASHVLTLAQAEADELREQSEAERIAFEAQRRSAEDSLRAQLEESRARLDQLRNDSEGQKARLEAELADHRVRVEAEFAAEMDGRRAALLEELAALEERQRAEADRAADAATHDARQRIGEATADAQRIRAEARQNVDDAHRELEGLRSLQHQVAEQLTSVRALLDWTLPQMPGPTASAGPRGADAMPPLPAPRLEQAPADPTSGEPVRTDPTRADDVQAPEQADRSAEPESGAAEQPGRGVTASPHPRPSQNGRSGARR